MTDLDKELDEAWQSFLTVEATEDVFRKSTHVFTQKMPDKLKARLKQLIYKERRVELQKLRDDFMPDDTNCAEFYTGGGANDGCEPNEHHRREGRFEVDMELTDFIEGRIKELNNAISDKDRQAYRKLWGEDDNKKGGAE